MLLDPESLLDRQLMMYELVEQRERRVERAKKQEKANRQKCLERWASRVLGKAIRSWLDSREAVV